MRSSLCCARSSGPAEKLFFRKSFRGSFVRACAPPGRCVLVPPPGINHVGHTTHIHICQRRPITTDGPFRHKRPRFVAKRKHYDRVLVFADVSTLLKTANNVVRNAKQQRHLLAQAQAEKRRRRGGSRMRSSGSCSASGAGGSDQVTVPASRFVRPSTARAFWEVFSKRTAQSLHLLSIREIHLILKAFDASFPYHTGGAPLALVVPSTPASPGDTSGSDKDLMIAPTGSRQRDCAHARSNYDFPNHLLSRAGMHLANFRMANSPEYNTNVNSLRAATLVSPRADYQEMRKNSWPVFVVSDLIKMFARRCSTTTTGTDSTSGTTSCYTMVVIQLAEQLLYSGLSGGTNKQLLTILYWLGRVCGGRESETQGEGETLPQLHELHQGVTCHTAVLYRIAGKVAREFDSVAEVAKLLEGLVSAGGFSRFLDEEDAEELLEEVVGKAVAARAGEVLGLDGKDIFFSGETAEAGVEFDEETWSSDGGEEDAESEDEEIVGRPEEPSADLNPSADERVLQCWLLLKAFTDVNVMPPKPLLARVKTVLEQAATRTAATARPSLRRDGTVADGAVGSFASGARGTGTNTNVVHDGSVKIPFDTIAEVYAAAEMCFETQQRSVRKGHDNDARSVAQIMTLEQKTSADSQSARNRE